MRLKEKMDTLRNERHAKTDELAQEWRKILTRNGDANKRLMDLMHDSTIEGLDPSKPFMPVSELRDPDLVARYGLRSKTGKAAQERIDRDSARQEAYDDLRARYMKLPQSFRDMYAQVRDAYAELADEFEDAIRPNAEKAMTVAVRRAERAQAGCGHCLWEPAKNPKKSHETCLPLEYSTDWPETCKLGKPFEGYKRNEIALTFRPAHFAMRFGNQFCGLRSVDSGNLRLK